MKKFPGSIFSFKLLYDKSSTSSTGNAPNPRGSVFSRLMEQLRILSFGIDDSERGSSSSWLLDRFKISRLIRFAMPGGTTTAKIKDYLLSSSNLNITYDATPCKQNFVLNEFIHALHLYGDIERVSECAWVVWIHSTTLFINVLTADRFGSCYLLFNLLWLRVIRVTKVIFTGKKN